MSSVKDEFLKFMKQGNLVQLAIAFVIGAAFSGLVQSLVTNVFTPLIGVAGHFDFSAWYVTINGSIFAIGAFLNQLISFVIVVLVVFFIIALPYQRYMDKKAAKVPTATMACPFCLTQIPINAKKCFACTSEVPPMK